MVVIYKGGIYKHSCHLNLTASILSFIAKHAYMYAANTLIIVCYVFLTNIVFFLHMAYLSIIVSGFDQAECFFYHVSG